MRRIWLIAITVVALGLCAGSSYGLTYAFMPWVVGEDTIAEASLGEERTYKVSGSGNFMCVAYDGDVGVTDFNHRVSGRNMSPVTIEVGDVLRLKAGNMISPTDQGLTERLAGDTLYPTSTYNVPGYFGPCAYVSWEQDGILTGVYPSTPRIVIMPVAQSPMPTNGNLVVTGFAAFFICEAPGDGNITGHWLSEEFIPVCEPSSVLALISGLAAFGGIAWRRK